MTLLKAGLAKYGKMKPECFNAPKCDPGYELELLSLLTTFMRVNLKFIYSDKAGCGDVLPNGSWSGLLGMLERGEIDFIANLCLLDESRMSIEWLSHSWPVLQEKQNYLIKAPKAAYEFSIFGPFQTITWITVFMSLCLFTFQFVCFYRIFQKYDLKLAAKKAVVDVLSMISGLDVWPGNHVWFCFTLYLGAITLLYSTFIKSAIMKPIEIRKPFKDNSELAQSLYTGKFKLVHYHTVPRLRCYENETCKKLNEAILKHGVHLINDGLHPDISTLMLSELLNNRHRVIVRNHYQLRIYLDEFIGGRDKMWLMEDKNVGDDWLVYYFRKNESFKQLVDKCLIEMGSASNNVKHLYLGLSYQTPDWKMIKNEIPERIMMNLTHIETLLFIYIGGLGISVFVLLLEFTWNKQNKQWMPSYFL